VRRFAIGSALIAALTALSACGTLGHSGSDSKEPPSETPPTNSAIVKSMHGGLIGGSIGAGLSDADRERALEAEYRALEYSPAGQAVTWKGEDEGTSGEAKAAQPYRVGSQDCRQYTQTVFRAGQARTARGTACRNADGSWTPLT
jgi:surface antigen